MKSERKLDFTPPLNEGTKTAQQNWTRRPRRLVWAAGRQPGWFLLAAPQAIMRFSALLASFAISHCLARIPEAELRSAGQTGRPPLRAWLLKSGR